MFSYADDVTTSLRWLFLDLNSYFASVEQELRPELRGRPVAVVPVMAETTCCIAVSYQARSYGVRTGVLVAEARALCPQIELVEARPKVYVEMHHRILEAIERCLPVEAVLSCDEFVCLLSGSQCGPLRAVELALEVKQAIREVGATLRCSIGLGPNRLLAKIAAEMQKPDGLMVVERESLPSALYGIELGDVPGIGERMERRLRAAGIESMRELCGLSRGRMGALWGSVLGERMWLLLRGEDLPEPPAGVSVAKSKTLSRQHILPPGQRTPEGARQVALKMLADCAGRLRKQGLWAAGLGVAIYYAGHDHAFEAHCRIAPCQDDLSLQEQFLPLWEGSPNQVPASLCVFLLDLREAQTADLFRSARDRSRVALAAVMDTVQSRYGRDAVYLASLHGAREAAPTRISFGPPPPLEEF